MVLFSVAAQSLFSRAKCFEGLRRRRWMQPLRQGAAIALGVGFTWPIGMPSAQAQAQLICGRATAEINEKSDLLRASVQGDRRAERSYGDRIKEHREFLKDCRRKNWPQNQAIWLRLYPCDVQPGVLDQVLDQVVNMGYNQVYVEVFYDGRVLLPQASNQTAWPSVLNQPGQEKIDLFQVALEKGRQRGLQVYAWMYTMNFGYSYGLRSDRRHIIARNGRGQTSREISGGTTETFIDPYNRQAMRDYHDLVQEVIKRRPDGVLFDYVRYPRGTGSASAAGSVKDLLIYSGASRQALINRATNQKGRELITRFIDRGYIAESDLKEIDKKYPQESAPLWQGRNPGGSKSTSLKQQREALQLELWLLSVAHAYQGVVDFLEMAASPVRQAGIPAGSVFFPSANKAVGQIGFDSRMQPWERFGSTGQWHPMAYSTCGNANCIVKEVEEVLNNSLNGVKVKPALAGAWGKTVRGNRPSLEEQMAALRSLSTRIETVSHFAYSWQQPQNDINRKACRVALR